MLAGQWDRVRVPVLMNTRGMTLMELLIVGFLVGIVFIGAAAMYVSGFKQTSKMRDNLINMDPKASIEEMARKVSFANAFSISGPQNRLRIRLDYSVGVTGALIPLRTPADFTDDQWIKYQFRNCGGGWPDGLYWRTDAAMAPDADCTGSDPDSQLLIPNVDVGSSEFVSIPNNDPAVDRVVKVTVVIDPAGSAPQSTIETDMALTSRPLG